MRRLRYPWWGLLALVLSGCLPTTPGLQAVIRTEPAPARGPYPLTVTFNGQASSGPIEEWTWTFFRLEGNEEIVLGPALSGPEVTYTFRERGRYRVYLTARGAAGKFAQAFVDVDVRSQPPVARLSADPYPEVQLGLTVHFDASLSSDPDGTIQSYLWNFGDGSWQETTKPHVSHKYREVGEYLVQLVVEDDAGDRSAPARLGIRVVPKGCGSCG
ncbi:MAG: PKD domain-containing protein [Candidatus Bipolaricaulaceae bacterium]